MVKDIFLIRKYTDKQGQEKSEWCKVGVCFGTNKDGSQNFELYTMPGVSFQIREREERERKGRGNDNDF
jgi:hypothetical protein